MKTLFVGHNLWVLNTVDSTNAYCWRKLSEGSVLDGTVVWAQLQESGKGQRGKSWDSTGGLAMSVVLHPKVSLNQQFVLNKAVAVAICDALADYGVQAKVKWPNDIYVGDRKLAGILIENSVRAHLLQQSVVGIGLNVRQDTFADDLPNPISLKQLLNQELEWEPLLEELCYAIEKRYLQFKAGHEEMIDKAYHQLLYKKGEMQSFEVGAVSFEALLKGVNKEGRLCLLSSKGEESYALGEVTHLVDVS